MNESAIDIMQSVTFLEFLVQMAGLGFFIGILAVSFIATVAGIIKMFELAGDKLKDWRD